MGNKLEREGHPSDIFLFPSGEWCHRESYKRNFDSSQFTVIPYDSIEGFSFVNKPAIEELNESLNRLALAFDKLYMELPQGVTFHPSLFALWACLSIIPTIKDTLEGSFFIEGENADDVRPFFY